MLTCVVCSTGFERTGSRGPVPKYCSDACRAKKQRTRPERKEYEREYRRAERASGKRRQYEHEYNRRPAVRERNRERMLIKWHNDPEYRERQLSRWRNPFGDTELPSPYTGHRWLDMAREAVTSQSVNPLTTYSDDYYDDMGEAVLALLEGRDPKEAVRAYRSKEYASRRLFIRTGDWVDDDGHDRFFEQVMPTVESAEDEYMAGVFVATRFNQVAKRRRRMKHKTQQPSRRRMKDGKGWKKRAA